MLRWLVVARPGFTLAVAPLLMLSVALAVGAAVKGSVLGVVAMTTCCYVISLLLRNTMVVVSRRWVWSFGGWVRRYDREQMGQLRFLDDSRIGLEVGANNLVVMRIPDDPVLGFSYSDARADALLERLRALAN